MDVTRAPSNGSEQISLRRLVGLSVTGRFIVDTSVRLFDPFLPLIAAGLGTSLVTIGGLVSLRSLMGLTSPVAGRLAEVRGYRPVLRGGLLILAAGMFLFGVSRSVWTAGIALLLMGLGIAAFTPLLQGYLSERLPYDQRARGIGIVEYAWALAGIFGLYSAGLIIARFGWRAPFFILGTALLLIWLLFRMVPTVIQPQRGAGPALSPRFLLSLFELREPSPSALAALAGHVLNFFAAVHIIVAHGAWLVDAYRLNAAALGTVALGLGFAELMGSVLVSIGVDRFGKRRAILWGGALSLVTYALLPLANVALLPAVAALLVGRFGFEIAIVSTIPLLSEQLPNQRARMLTLGAAGATLAGALAGLTGTFAYTRYGLMGMSIPAAVAVFLALLAFLLVVRERPADLSPTGSL